ncbi:hypothetical protein [uncultured Dokdonia sp.]|uniref:hypothetical protein n=1 Tax=uncultured Dokdonia sp. TaxID=575653 RepID=UPI00260E3FD0|nr:hypothetical protein [uncultured Dokdonia sp.]
MIEYRKVVLEEIDAIIKSCSRSHFEYQEHRSLSIEQLSKYAKNSLDSLIAKSSTLAYSAHDNDVLLGIIFASKNEFDSEMFDLCCYQISKLFIFSEDASHINEIGTGLLDKLETELRDTYDEVHVSMGLNNNIQNMDVIFNTLAASNYYYLHTLLTFSSNKTENNNLIVEPNNKVIIREATDNDALQVASIAKKSFKYSRFHLDPFLDNEKSSNLLENSAKNSILNGYVDVMYVAEVDSKIIGYYSCKKRFIKEFDKTIATASISAVDSDYRGLGVFGTLNDNIIAWCGEFADFLEMGTYLANYPVHKTWINKGFKLVRGTHQFSKLLNKSTPKK